MNFEFATASRIIFGSGTLKEIGPIAKSFGVRALVVTGADTGRASRLLRLLDEAGVGTAMFAVGGEPSIETVEAGMARAREQGCDLVISIGGGSAIDAGKAIAVMLTNSGNLLDYLEVIGGGKTLALAPAPFVAIPTTSGTGTEVTRNAVLSSSQYRVKVSLRSPLMLPKVALVDPELTLDLPRNVTAASGLDALTQLIEPFISLRANPMIDALCVEGIRRVAHSLRRACSTGSDLAARQEMALASLWSGIALANAGLGVVHGFAGPIGGMFPAPHGAICAALLPHAMAVNLRALRERQPGCTTLGKFEEMARLLTGDAQAKSEDGIRWLAGLADDLEIPPLARYGIGPEDTAQIVEKAAVASSMKANPLPLTAGELTEIFNGALGERSKAGRLLTLD